MTESATEHLVVIIDAGSRGIHRDAKCNKSKINTTVMLKFWKACAQESATNGEIEDMWRQSHDMEECLKTATEAWHSWPFLTRSEAAHYTLRQMRVAFLGRIPPIGFPTILSFLIGDSTLKELVAASQIISGA